MTDGPDPGAGMGLGLKLRLTPAGWPLALNATVLLKLPKMVEVIVAAPLWPCATMGVLGEADSVSGYQHLRFRPRDR